jgi:dihydropteridine reductase
MKWVLSVDMKENKNADANILVTAAESASIQGEKIEQDLKSFVSNDDQKLDAILNVAGGWAGGNAAHAQFIQNCDLMWKQSVWSSVISASLASKFLKENGLLTLTGSAAALGETPGMIGYGMAKTAVHHLTKSLSEPSGGLPANSTVTAILPVTLDTPMNRKWMPNADYSSWTSLAFVAELFEKWVNNEDRPVSGKLVKLVTKDNQTEISHH